jgi:hypothetical protein
MSSNPAIVIGVSAVDTSKEVLSNVDSNVKHITETITAENEKIVSKTQQLTTKFREHGVEIARSTAELSAGIVGFATDFDVLGRAQVKASQSTLSYEKAQAKLEAMQKSGKYTAEQLAQQQEAVRIASEKQDLAQGHLHDTYANFLAHIPGEMFNFGSSAAGIWQLVGASQKTSAVQTAVSAATYNGVLASMSAANSATATTTQILGRVMQSVFLSNPITLPLIAVSAVVMALAFNVGGLRDRVNELGKAIGDAIPFLRPFLEALGSLQNLFGGNAEKSKDLADATNALADAENAAKTSTDNFATSTTSAGHAVASLKDKVQTLTEYMQAQDSSLAKSYHDNLLYVQSTGAVKDALALSNDELNHTAEFLRKQASEAQKNTQDNFNLVASHNSLQIALNLTDERLQIVADTLRAQEAAQEAAQKAAASAANATSAAYANQKTQANNLQTALEALAAAQQRSVIMQFGQAVGLGGTVSLDALNAAGFGNNAGLVESAKAGRLGGVFTPSGRVLDTGGTLYEDVIGVGKDTGTPHYLHKGEDIVPPNKRGNVPASRGNSPNVTVNVYPVVDTSGKLLHIDVEYAGRRKRSSYTQIITSPGGIR